ncbi:hypothetical protein [Nocardia concava]|uniref:hypothetical protein n=1 Tax=Nocardia concava TaxID=257281 RepID=UPI0002F26A0B|nr:hypothetical protein [Nocardia concava]
MSDSGSSELASSVLNDMSEWCVVCKDWAYPTWTLTWVGGHTEIRCGIHGGRDFTLPPKG